MTISSQTSKAAFSGNGVSTVFPLPFPYLREADIKALLRQEGFETPLELGTHYSLGGAGSSQGGTLTMNLPPATGQTLVVYRAPAIVQEVDYVENSAFPAETHEAALDLLTMICQSLQEQLGRAVLYPVSTPADDVLGSQDFLAATAQSRDAARNAEQNAAASAGQAGLFASRAAASAASAEAVVSTADGLVKVSVGDAAARSLSSKLLAGNGLAEGIENPGGDEALRLAVALADDSGLEFAGGLLRVECGAGLARTASGLAVSAGTGAGQLVQLDANGYLPALDARNLTNLPISQSDDLAARDNAAMNAFVTWLAHGKPTGGVPRGALWTFATDELPTKTNATYNADGDYYTNAAQVNGAQPTSATAITGGYTRIDKTLTIPVNNTVRSLGVYSTVATSGRLQIVRWDAASTYTALAEVTFSHTGSGWEYFALATPYTTAASGTFHIASYQPSNTTMSARTGISSEYRAGLLTIGASTGGWADGSPTLIPSGAYETSPADMTLVGGPVALGYVPAKATVYILHRAVDAVALNTDVKVRASHGSTWTFATNLTALCQYSAEYRLLRATVDLSAQSNGSNAYWALETCNNKSQRVRGALLWEE